MNRFGLVIQGMAMFVTALLASAVAIGDHAQTQPATSQPHSSPWADCLVRPDQEVIDFGVIPTNETVRTKLRITNYDTNTRDLVRAQGKTTAIVWPKPNTKLAPGETIELECRINGPPRAGQLNGKTAIIICEGQRNIIIPIRATVISYVEVEPASIDLDGEVNPVLCLRSIDGQPFRIMSAQPKCLDFLTTESKTEHQVMFNTDEFRSLGLRRQMMIYLDHPKCQQVSMPVMSFPADAR